MIERLFAGLVLAACAVLLVRLLLNDRRRYRFDMAMRRFWGVVERGARRLWHAPRAWRERRDAQRHAEEVAIDAIRRASGRGVARLDRWRAGRDG